MARALVAAAVLILATGLDPNAQSTPQATPLVVKRDRVDFTGRWQAADDAGSHALGKEFTATQDATSLTIETATFNYSGRPGAEGVSTPGPARRRTYQFNGVESRESFPVRDQFAVVDRRLVFSGYTTSTSSRAAWQGDRLVIVTHNTMQNHRPRHSPEDYESEQTTRLALSLAADGTLIAERIIIADPDGDSTLRMDRPSVIKTVYKKAGH